MSPVETNIHYLDSHVTKFSRIYWSGISPFPLEDNPLENMFTQIGNCDVIRFPSIYPHKIITNLLTSLSFQDPSVRLLLHGSRLYERLIPEITGRSWNRGLGEGGHGRVGNDTDVEILTKLPKDQVAQTINRVFTATKLADDQSLRQHHYDPVWFNRLHLATRHSLWGIPDYQVLKYAYWPNSDPDEIKSLFEFHYHDLTDPNVISTLHANYFQFYTSRLGMGGLLLSIDHGQIVQKLYQPYKPLPGHANEVYLTNPETVLHNSRALLTAPRLALAATAGEEAIIHPTHARLVKKAVETQLQSVDHAHLLQMVNRMISCAAQAEYLDKPKEFLSYLSQLGLPQAFLTLSLPLVSSI